MIRLTSEGDIASWLILLAAIRCYLPQIPRKERERVGLCRPFFSFGFWHWGTALTIDHASGRNKRNLGGTGKEAVFSLVERGGRVRSHHIPTMKRAITAFIITWRITSSRRRAASSGENW
jgi:hypothetical protein